MALELWHKKDEAKASRVEYFFTGGAQFYRPWLGNWGAAAADASPAGNKGCACVLHTSRAFPHTLQVPPPPQFRTGRGGRVLGPPSAPQAGSHRVCQASSHWVQCRDVRVHTRWKTGSCQITTFRDFWSRIGVRLNRNQEPGLQCVNSL